MVVAMTLGAGVAGAQQIKNGDLTGTVMSGHALVDGNGQANVLQTPTKGQFIMTQFCKEANSTQLQGSTVGVITTDNDCTTFFPGVAIPANEILFCRNLDGQSRSCSVTGVLSKK
jgi:hypothetical protein